MCRTAMFVGLGVSILSVLSTGCTTGQQRKGLVLDPAPAGVLKHVADFVLKDFASPPEFNWGEGVLMAGMMQAGQAAGDPEYVAFVQRWADHWNRKGLEPVLREKGYCGHWGPAYPVALLYRISGETQHLKMAGDVVRFMQTDATRTSDSGLGHWHDNYQLWVDTLFMCCPVYAEMAEICERPGYLDEAVRQLNTFADRLQDAETGLFYHMYDEPKGTRTDELWGRGNGWAAMSYVSVLRYLPKSHWQYPRVAGDFKRLAEALIAVQDPESGMYHTVLDRRDSYEETSATAMILYSLIEGKRLGLVRIDDEQFVQRTWSALMNHIEDSGRVAGVSTGTGPTDFARYNSIPIGTETWGTGAMLMLAAACCGS